MPRSRADSMTLHKSKLATPKRVFAEDYERNMQIEDISAAKRVAS